VISSKLLGERIAACRGRRSLTQAQLADAIGVSRATVIAFEKGERRPRSDVLMAIARALEVAVNDLLREHAVFAEVSPRFRALKRGANAGADAAVETLRSLGERYAELERLVGVPRPKAPLEAVNAFRAAPEERMPIELIDPVGRSAAASVRRQLALGEGPFHAVEEQLEREAGFRIFLLPIPASISAIFIWGDEIGACIALNRDHPPERRRWSLCHELAHFLRDREAGDILPERFSSRDPGEVFCDAFASELLLPAEGVRRDCMDLIRANGGRLSPEDILVLAKSYGVSFQAMTMRLEELQILPRGTYQSLKTRGFKPGRHQLAEPPGPEYDALTPVAALPRRFVLLALRAFDEEKLSELELAKFLGCDRQQALAIHEGHRRSLGEASSLDLSPSEDLLKPRGSAR